MHGREEEGVTNMNIWVRENGKEGRKRGKGRTRRMEMMVTTREVKWEVRPTIAIVIGIGMSIRIMSHHSHFFLVSIFRSFFIHILSPPPHLIYSSHVSSLLNPQSLLSTYHHLLSYLVTFVLLVIIPITNLNSASSLYFIPLND